jgi:hypothetical protein
MKKFILFSISILLVGITSLESCGPVIISSRPSHPPPPWFYPSRVVNVRYVFFPDFSIYYDLTLRNYLYFEKGSWISVNVLPPRYNNINFRKTKQIRINNYFGDNIREYHPKNTYLKGRRATTSSNRKN